MKTLFLSVFALTFLISCGDNGPTIFEDDFSTVPEPFSIQGITPDTTESGLIVYNLDAGTGQLSVGIRDDISIFYTGSKIDGEIFDSSFKNGRTTPITLPVLGFVEGFREGVLDKREGSRFVLIIPPSLGYEGYNGPDRTLIDLRDDTLRFDVELDEIIF